MNEVPQDFLDRLTAQNPGEDISPDRARVAYLESQAMFKASPPPSLHERYGKWTGETMARMGGLDPSTPEGESFARRNALTPEGTVMGLAGLASPWIRIPGLAAGPGTSLLRQVGGALGRIGANVGLGGGVAGATGGDPMRGAIMGAAASVPGEIVQGVGVGVHALRAAQAAKNSAPDVGATSDRFVGRLWDTITQEVPSLAPLRGAGGVPALIKMDEPAVRKALQKTVMQPVEQALKGGQGSQVVPLRSLPFEPDPAAQQTYLGAYKVWANKEANFRRGLGTSPGPPPNPPPNGYNLDQIFTKVEDLMHSGKARQVAQINEELGGIFPQFAGALQQYAKGMGAYRLTRDVLAHGLGSATDPVAATKGVLDPQHLRDVLFSRQGLENYGHTYYKPYHDIARGMFPLGATNAQIPSSRSSMWGRMHVPTGIPGVRVGFGEALGGAPAETVQVGQAAREAAARAGVPFRGKLIKSLGSLSNAGGAGLAGTTIE